MLLEADCLQVLRTLDDHSVDLIATDPPYGMAYQSGHRKKKFALIHGDKSCDVFLEALPEMVRILRPNRHAYIFCSWHHIDIFKQAIEKHLTIKNLLVWNKNNHGAGDLCGSYAPRHELIIFAHKGRRKLRGRRHPDVIDCAKVASAAMCHPTEKPVSLMEQLIHASTDIGEVVFDPFLGSGTTAVAAIHSGRRWIGIERDRNYAEIARERVERALVVEPG